MRAVGRSQVTSFRGAEGEPGTGMLQFWGVNRRVNFDPLLTPVPGSRYARPGMTAAFADASLRAGGEATQERQVAISQDSPLGLLGCFASLAMTKRVSADVSQAGDEGAF